jgi:hypothetical protein
MERALWVDFFHPNRVRVGTSISLPLLALPAVDYERDPSFAAAFPDALRRL